jgi:hypothetical protein
MEFLAVLAIAIGSWLHVPGGSWNPDAQQVTQARSQLESYISRSARLAGETLPAWDSYTFQYQGREQGGKQVIVVNAFCGTPPTFADVEWVEVFDGGACYFNAYWDPVEKVYVSVQFNGHA